MKHAPSASDFTGRRNAHAIRGTDDVTGAGQQFLPTAVLSATQSRKNPLRPQVARDGDDV